jgi:pyrimidine-nucleoside phosphorylase
MIAGFRPWRTAYIFMNIHELICKKRDGRSLEGREIGFIIGRYMAGKITESQMAAFLMAVVIKGMTLEETVYLTREMMNSGEVLHFDDLSGPVVDKHSTGGVGDKISLILLPIAIECGLHVPMISGRALGFTGGTLDKLESIPGMITALLPERIKKHVYELGGCFSAQTERIVPADKKMYALRDSTATVESVPLIVSSILSKKFAEGVDGVVVDVKCGRGAFMRELQDARELSLFLESVASEMGFRVRTVISSMDEPLGRAVGNALEVEESIRTLQGMGPEDCLELTHRLVSEMLCLGGMVSGIDEGKERSTEALESGRAFERFLKIVAAQGGNLDLHRKGFGLPRAKVSEPLLSSSDGYLTRIDSRIIGEAVRDLGGGRRKMDDSVDHAVGLVVLKRRGDRISRGEHICEIHASSKTAAIEAKNRIINAFEIADDPVLPFPLFLDESS